MVIGGKMKIALRERTLELGEGEIVIIPRGVDHKPLCEGLCMVLLVLARWHYQYREYRRSPDRYAG